MDSSVETNKDFSLVEPSRTKRAADETDIIYVMLDSMRRQSRWVLM